MKKLTQYQKLLNYFLSGASISNLEATDFLKITGSSFHRLIKTIQEKFNIDFEKYQKGEGSGFYYVYRLSHEDIKMIKKLLKSV